MQVVAVPQPRSQRLMSWPATQQKKSASTTKAKEKVPRVLRQSSASGVLERLAAQIRVCTRCPLCQSRTLAVPGEGRSNAPVMVIGEGPGSSEDKTGRPFVGNAGRYLDHVLEGSGFDRSDFFITNIVKCRPPSNRTPRTEEIETCTSLYLNEQIKQVGPRLVLLLGSVAVKKMLGAKSVEEVRGKIIEREGRKFLASYHPAVRFYREDLAQKIKLDFALMMKELKRL